MRRVLVAAGLFALAVGCASSPGSQRIIGPDGTEMAHVHCGSDQGSCFRLAGELCPSGYDMQAALAGHDGNFLVRCRAPRRTAEVATTATACASAAQHVAAKQRDWPPSNEPWPATYPWPPPETSAAVQAPPSSQPSKPPLEIDLGY